MNSSHVKFTQDGSGVFLVVPWAYMGTKTREIGS